MIELYRGVWVVAYRELLRVLNERSRLVGLLLMPVMILLVFGIGFNSMVGSLGPGVDYIQFLFPGIIAMNAGDGTINPLLDSIFIHPTMMEGVQSSAEVVGSAKPARMSH